MDFVPKVSIKYQEGKTPLLWTLASSTGRKRLSLCGRSNFWAVSCLQGWQKLNELLNQVLGMDIWHSGRDPAWHAYIPYWSDWVESWSWSWFQFPANMHLRKLVITPVAGPCKLCGRPQLSSSSWNNLASTSCWGHLENKPADDRSLSSLSQSLCFSNKQIISCTNVNISLDFRDCQP